MVGLEAGPSRQPRREAGFDHPLPVLGPAGRLCQEEVDPGLGQDFRLLAQVCLALLLGVVAPVIVVSGPERLTAKQNAEVGNRAGDIDRPLFGRPVARLLRQHDGAQVELPRQVAQAQRLKTVTRRRVGVRRDDVDAGLDIGLMHEAHGVRVVVLGDPSPGGEAHRYAEFMQLHANRAVENDHLALSDTAL